MRHRILAVVVALAAVAVAFAPATAGQRFRLFSRGPGPCPPPCYCPCEPSFAPSFGPTAVAPEAPQGPFVYRRRDQFTPAPEDSGFPVMAVKPEPKSHTFLGCPPEGKGGDPELNFLKNRTDVAADWLPVKFNTLLNLSFPEDLPRKRDNWTQSQINRVGRYEGTPVSVECFILSAHKAGKESCNCGKSTADMVDFHVDLVKAADDDRDSAVVAEVTGRLREKHPEWTLAAIKALAKNDTPVRISGWVLLDQIHPDLIEEGIRGTIWEIHPVMKIEVKKGNTWVPLGTP